ncbi:hypothetical protein L7F22_053307 [Adiantum nelumboides]|nr:hypothetical protein [Adiantum nelumboides]
MGACSSKPKTADFEQFVSTYPEALQFESETKSLKYELQTAKTGINDNSDSERKNIPDLYATLSVSPTEDTNYGSVQDAVLPSKHKAFAIINVEQNEKTEVQSEPCDVERRDRFAFKKPSQLITSMFKRPDYHHRSVVQKKKAVTQNPQKKAVFLETDTRDQARACKTVTSGESHGQDEPVTWSLKGAQLHNSEHLSKTQSALIISQTHDSEWTTLNFSTNSSPNFLSNVLAGDANFTDSYKDASICGVQHSVASTGVKTYHVASIFEPDTEYHDDTPIFFDKEDSTLSYIELCIEGEPGKNLVNQLNNNPQEPKSKVEQRGWHALELVKPSHVDKLEVIKDMDQMLEKLASEFERQESLHSYSLV